MQTITPPPTDSTTVSAAISATVSPTERFRAAELGSIPAGGGQQLVYSRQSGEIRLLPDPVVNILKRSRTFATLDQHARAGVRALKLAPERAQRIQGRLAELAQAGFLVSYTDTREAFIKNAQPSEPPPRVGMIGFASRNRTALLERAVRSFAENGKKHGRTTEFVVMDDSEKDDYAPMLREVMREQNISISYAHRGRRTEFANLLAKEAGVDPAVLQFALMGPQEFPYLCGANRNCLALHAAGDILFSADDDTVCRLAPGPKKQDGLIVGSGANPLEYWFYADREAAFRSVQWEEPDVLALHEQMLGRRLGDCVASQAKGVDVNFDQLDLRFQKSLERGQGRVMVTMLGLVGDCAVDWPRWFLLGGEARERLLKNETTYRTGFLSREILRAANRATISGSPRCMTYALGYDHRQILPPFFPMGRSSDGLFSISLLVTQEDSYLAHVPWVIEHSPAEKRMYAAEYVRDDANARGVWALMDLCLRLCQFGSVPYSTEARYAKLGQHLREVATMPPADFEELIRLQTWQQMSSTFTNVEQMLKQYRETPEYWARDVRQYLDSLRDALGKKEYIVPTETRVGRSGEEGLGVAQQLVGQFGNMITAWPAVVAATLRLRARGERLAQPL